MVRKSFLSISATILVAILFVPGSSYAIMFQDYGKVAHHYDNDGATSEYFLVFDSNIAIAPNTLKVKGFSIGSQNPEGISFAGLEENDGASIDQSFSINRNSKYFRKLDKKWNKLSRKGKTDLGREEWINAQLEDRLFKMVFKDENGTKYKGLISFASFHNPANGEFQTSGGDSNGVAPVPEPSTLLLLGAGMLGLASMRRKFNK